MVNIDFSNENYEKQLTMVMLEALEKQGIISITSKDNIISEIERGDEIWQKAIS